MYRSAANTHHPPGHRHRPHREALLWLLWRLATPVVALGELVARLDLRMDSWFDPSVDPAAPTRPALWWVDLVAVGMLLAALVVTVVLPR